MKNVTISMDEDTAEWARIEAARAGRSVSSFIGQQMSRLRGGSGGFEAGIAAFLSTPKARMSDGGRTFNRSEIYDRPVFKRFR